ncbi:FeoB-associated Cys-rich membrane protein [Acetatifactor muris]|jgi:hypothetical protein|uniref:Virus attachment protein p12 family protein n=1 Tax=Acetatifactor muris TaxID=879566 RepID=A0A2K4ZKT2_9FIRM|nr:FeoB-associated Cys-rich membrane protein [Acetatifactor muris]MCI8801251.1 FeoB-associated Cys-rich membrane protein [Lachnospiraceae bacterium]MCR2049520.1 FeoB-associated Cys-rich membrane protein [Acetatifactor muris]SOY31099.1 Virus attachment protein p12 family protein [Acetatifactor muris]
MFDWIAENAATIIISVILIAVVAAIVTSMIRNKKKGKSSCGCGCANCPMGAACHSGKQNDSV